MKVTNRTIATINTLIEYAGNENITLKELLEKAKSEVVIPTIGKLKFHIEYILGGSYFELQGKLKQHDGNIISVVSDCLDIWLSETDEKDSYFTYAPFAESEDYGESVDRIIDLLCNEKISKDNDIHDLSMYIKGGYDMPTETEIREYLSTLYIY